MDKTVSARPVDSYPAWILAWDHQVKKADVGPAFRELTRGLDASETSLWVIVDLQNNPIFPLQETITSALWGPFRHRRLREWLVVGSNATAQLIGRTLTAITGRANIRWFNTMESAYEYMNQAVADMPHPG